MSAPRPGEGCGSKVTVGIDTGGGVSHAAVSEFEVNNVPSTPAVACTVSVPVFEPV